MSEDIHDVVELMLARMESHPEEFRVDQSDYALHDARWWKPLATIRDYGSKEEQALINAKLREIQLQQAHEWAMDELCNGEERRRKEEEEREYERNLLKSIQQQAYTTAAQNQMPGAIIPVSGSFGEPLMATPHPVGPAPVTARAPTASDMENNGIMNALRKAFK